MSTFSLSEVATGELTRSTGLTDKLREAASGITAALAWAAFGASCLVREDVGDWSRTTDLAIAAFVVATLVLVASIVASRLGRAGTAIRQRSPWLIALGVFLSLWELATAKFACLPLPFFPPPQAIIEVY